MVNRLSFYDLVRSQLELMEKSDYCTKLWAKIRSKKNDDDFDAFSEISKMSNFEECWKKLYELVQQAKQSLEL